VLLKKRYYLGIGLLALACFLMHLFAKSLENLRLIHYFLEAIGYYTGYLDNPDIHRLQLVLVIAIIVLLVLALIFIIRALDEESKKRYTVIPICILSVSIISCFTFPFINGLYLSTQRGLGSIIMERRDIPPFRATGNPYDGQDTDYFLYLTFYELSNSSEPFYVKIVDMNDTTNEIVLEHPINISDSTISESFIRDIGVFSSNWYYSGRSYSRLFALENIPGYDRELDNFRDLRFKIVIFNENDSKTFYRYFYRNW